ncbi:MAG: hypothetical protein K5924_12535 [Chloroflexi bacterium]|nr:hypothetical protein [Chloroflexota bacterium]
MQIIATRFGPVYMLVAGSVAAMQLLPGLLSGPNFDASVFLLIGERLLEGTRPYVELWDHKPPGIYLIDAALIGTLGAAVGAWPAVWLGSVVAHVATGVVVLRVLTGHTHRWVAAAAGLMTVAVGAAWPFALGGGLTESFAAPLAVLAWLVALAARSWRGWAAAGVLIVLASAVSLYALPAVIAVAITASMRPRRAATAVALGVSVSVTAALGLMVVAAAGMLPAMLDALAGYNGAYRASSMAAPLPESLAISPSLVAWYAVNGMAIVAPATVGLFSQAHRHLVVAALGWTVGAAVMIAVGGRLYGHYLALVAPPLGVLAGIGIAEAAAWASGRKRLLVTLGVAMAVGTSAAAMYAALLTSTPDAYSHQQRDLQAATFVAERTQPGERVLVWGNAPMVYQLSRTDPAWRYPYLLPLLTPGYVTPNLVEELRAQLEAAPPCLVVDAGSPAPGQAGLPPLLVARPLTPSERRIDLLDPVRIFVGERYRELAVVDGWPIYELASGSC